MTMPDKMQVTYLTRRWLTKDMVMQGKFVLRLPKLKLHLFVVLDDSVEAAVKAGDLLRQLAHF